MHDEGTQECADHGDDDDRIAEREAEEQPDQTADQPTHDRAAPAPRPGVQVLGGFHEPDVDLLERDVDRQGHERQEVIGDARDHRGRRRQDAELGRQEAQVLERPEQDPVVAEDDLPALGAQQEAREERRDDQEQQEVLVAAAAERDRVRERVGDQETDHGRRGAIDERAQELLLVALDRVGVGRPVGQRDRVALFEAARPERADEHLDARVHVEHEQPEDAGREQQVWRQPPDPLSRTHLADASGGASCP